MIFLIFETREQILDYIKVIIEKQQRLYLVLLDQWSRSYCKAGSGYAMNMNGFQGQNIFRSCQKRLLHGRVFLNILHAFRVLSTYCIPKEHQ